MTKLKNKSNESSVGKTSTKSSLKFKADQSQRLTKTPDDDIPTATKVGIAHSRRNKLHKYALIDVIVATFLTCSHEGALLVMGVAANRNLITKFFQDYDILFQQHIMPIRTACIDNRHEIPWLINQFHQSSQLLRQLLYFITLCLHATNIQVVQGAINKSRLTQIDPYLAFDVGLVNKYGITAQVVFNTVKFYQSTLKAQSEILSQPENIGNASSNSNQFVSPHENETIQEEDNNSIDNILIHLLPRLTEDEDELERQREIAENDQLNSLLGNPKHSSQEVDKQRRNSFFKPSNSENKGPDHCNENSNQHFLSTQSPDYSHESQPKQSSSKDVQDTCKPFVI